MTRLRILRRWRWSLRPGEKPIYGPGGKGQMMKKPVDALQFSNEEDPETGEFIWQDVWIEDTKETII